MGKRGPQPKPKSPCSTAECGGLAKYRNPDLCNRCKSKATYQPQSPRLGPRIPRLHLTGTTYDGAHKHLRHWRGRAADHECSSCSSQAQEWAFAPVSDRWVQSGTVVNAKGYVSAVRWSAHVSDYKPLCKPCHVRLDRWPKAPTPAAGSTPR